MTHFLVSLFFSCVIQLLQISAAHFVSHRFQIPILPNYFRSLRWLSLQLRKGLIKLNIFILSSQQIQLLVQSQLGSSLCLPLPSFCLWFAHGFFFFFPASPSLPNHGYGGIPCLREVPYTESHLTLVCKTSAGCNIIQA